MYLEKCKKLIEDLREKKLKALRSRLRYKKRVNDAKTKAYKDSHSLLWVWEFSKKAVLICFVFYVIVQLYAMYVMFKSYDFTYLGELINQTGQILQNCVFAYLIKGVRNTSH